MNDFLEKQSDEELMLIERMLLAALDSQHYVGYMRGQIDMLRERKFSVCRCGTNHEKEASDALGEAAEAVSTEVVENAANVADEPEEDTEFLMAKYSVQVVPSDLEEHYPTKYRCSVCFTPIVSLEDRMRRPPGTPGCSGCKSFNSQGAKWFGR